MRFYQFSNIIIPEGVIGQPDSAAGSLPIDLAKPIQAIDLTRFLALAGQFAAAQTHFSLLSGKYRGPHPLQAHTKVTAGPLSTG
jgi:hypothetical protein